MKQLHLEIAAVTTILPQPMTCAEEPPHRLEAQGAAALSDSELLSLVLHYGMKSEESLALARQLLLQAGDPTTSEPDRCVALATPSRRFGAASPAASAETGTRLKRCRREHQSRELRVAAVGPAPPPLRSASLGSEPSVQRSHQSCAILRCPQRARNRRQVCNERRFLLSVSNHRIRRTCLDGFKER
jgi:hypothetical protein